jgi:hypothetical protein
MKQMIERALSETRAMWEPLRRAYRWVWAAAKVLANTEQKHLAEVRAAYVRVLRSIGVTKRHCGALQEALTHFLKVTRSYRDGLFHCDEDTSIPRTNILM